MSRLPASRLLLLAVMVWGLVLAPFGHDLALAAALSGGEQAVPHCCCHHHTKTPANLLYDCCCHKGHVCHCIATVALPVSQPLTLPAASVVYAAVSFPCPADNLPPPEPPPPRLT
jgi:hypothetical protein